MLEHRMFDDTGIKSLCSIEGEHKDMLMDIDVIKMKQGEHQSFYSGEKETAILLLEGAITYTWCGEKKAASRKNVFEEGPYCLHAPKAMEMVIEAQADSEILVQKTVNDTDFDAHFYTPEECLIEEMGKEQWQGTAYRAVLTVFDYKNAPYSNMVIGEVFSKPGRWSSYVPHSHPQPEVYYYKFDRKQGFGTCFIGEDAYKVTDGSAAYIPGGLTHPQNTAPGYTMYYCWMIRHLPDNPWQTRDFDENHIWLLSE